MVEVKIDSESPEKKENFLVLNFDDDDNKRRVHTYRLMDMYRAAGWMVVESRRVPFTAGVSLRSGKAKMFCCAPPP